MKLDSEGFTIPELLSVLVVTGIFVSLILFFTISYWRYAFLLEADQDTLVTRLNAGDYLREAIGGSNGLIEQNSIPDSHTNSPDSSIASGLYWQHIHAKPGNFAVGPANTYTPILYFKHFSQDTSKNFIMNTSQPFEDEYVLYLNSSTKQLLVRTLANTNAAGNSQKTSCPSSASTPSCPTDKIVASDIASIDVRYFSRSGNLIDYTSLTDPVTQEFIGPDYSQVEVVEFTLNITQKPIFQKTNATSNSTIIRIALRNA